VRPMTLISLGTFAPSFSSETETPRDRAAFTGESPACVSPRTLLKHFGDVVAGDLHLHGADLHFEVVVVHFADDLRGASGRLELDCIAFGNVLHQLRLGVGVAAVSSADVRDYGEIELLAESRRNWQCGAPASLEKLLRSSAILNGVDGFAGVIFEVAQEAFQLLLHLATLVCCSFFSFGGDLKFFVLDFLPARFQAQAFGVGLTEFVVQFVEKLANVSRLGAKARSCRLDDLGIQA